MPLIRSQLTDDGAVVDVLIGVSRNREAKLRNLNLAVPEKVPLRLQIDTGSSVTMVLSHLVRSLEIGPFDQIPVRTSSTNPGQPHIADRYDVRVYLVSGTTLYPIPRAFVLGGEDFEREEGIQGIIGRDVLEFCTFHYHGTHKSFDFGF